MGIALSVLLLACSDDSRALVTSTPASPELVAAGEASYAHGEHGCAGCHGEDARGGERAGGIVGASASSVREALQIPAMSSIELTDDQIEALAAYLESLQE